MRLSSARAVGAAINAAIVGPARITIRRKGRIRASGLAQAPCIGHFMLPGTWLGQAALVTRQPRRAGIVATRPTTVLMLPASGFAAMAARTAEAWRWLALLSVAAFPWQDGVIRCVGHIICAPLPGQKHSAMMAWQCRPGPAYVRLHCHPPAFRASRRVWCGCALALNKQSRGRGRPHPGHPSPAIESGGVSPKEMFSVLGNLGGIQGGTLRRRSAGLKPVVAAGTGSAPFTGARSSQPVAPVPRVAPRPRSCP